MTKLSEHIAKIKKAIAEQDKVLFEQYKKEAFEYINKALSHGNFPHIRYGRTDQVPTKMILDTVSNDVDFLELKEDIRHLLTDPVASDLYALELILGVQSFANFISDFAEEIRATYQAQLYNVSELFDLGFLLNNKKQTVLGKEPKVNSFLLSGSIPMSPRYWGESEVHTKPDEITPYLTRKEKKRLKVRLSNSGNLTCQSYPKIDGTYLYILSPKGGLYILNENDTYHNIKPNYGWHHSGIRAGQPVFCAGHLIIKNNKIITINNDSGHYCPPKDNLEKTCLFLYDKGMLDKNCVVNNRSIRPHSHSGSEQHSVMYSDLMEDDSRNAFIPKFQTMKQQNILINKRMRSAKYGLRDLAGF